MNTGLQTRIGSECAIAISPPHRVCFLLVFFFAKILRMQFQILIRINSGVDGPVHTLTRIKRQFHKVQLYKENIWQH